MHKRTGCVEALLLNPFVSLSDVAKLLQAEWLAEHAVDVTADAIECTDSECNTPVVPCHVAAWADAAG
jgi:hypothetical protein